MSVLTNFLGGILSVLINISFEIVRILIRYKEKLELKKEIRNLIKSDVEESNRLFNEILMDLSKIFGATLFLPEREYSNMLDRVINEVNVGVSEGLRKILDIREREDYRK